MLLVFVPLSHVLFSVAESVSTFALAFPLHVFTFVHIAIAEHRLSLSVRAASFQFAGIFRAILKLVVSQ